MGVVNSKMGVTAIFSRAFRAHSVLCLPAQKFLRAPLRARCKSTSIANLETRTQGKSWAGKFVDKSTLQIMELACCMCWRGGPGVAAAELVKGQISLASQPLPTRRKGLARETRGRSQ